MILTEAQAEANIYKVVTKIFGRQMLETEMLELGIAIGKLQLATAKDTFKKAMGILNDKTT